MRKCRIEEQVLEPKKINRATRIWIPYASAIIFLYGFAAISRGIDFFWFKYLFFDSTFTHQLFTHFPGAAHELPLDGSGNQFWSISVEEQFYLIAPAIMLTGFGRQLLIWIPIALALMLGNVMGAPIALGVIAAILHRDYRDWHLKPAVRVVVIVAALASFGGMFLTSLPFLRPLFAVCVVLMCAVPGNRTALSIFVGGISYPMYLNHWIGAFVAHRVIKHFLHYSGEAGMQNVGYVALAYATSLAVGASGYWLIDRQVLAQRENWFTPQRGMACGAIAYLLVAIGVLGGLWIG